MFLSPSNYFVTQAINSLGMQLRAGITLNMALKGSGPRVRGTARKAFNNAATSAEAGEPIQIVLDKLSPILTYGERSALATAWDAGRVDEVIAGIVKRRETIAETSRYIVTQMIHPLLILTIALVVGPMVRYILGALVGKPMTLLEFLFAASWPPVLIFGTIAGAYWLYLKRAWKLSHRPVSMPTAPPDLVDHLMFRIPFFQKMEHAKNISEFCDQLSYALKSGMIGDAALRSCVRAMPNGIYRAEVERLAIETARGTELVATMKTSPLWPLELTDVLHIAEVSGELEVVLSRMGQLWRDIYLQQVRLIGVLIARGAYAAVFLYVLIQILAKLGIR